MAICDRGGLPIAVHVASASPYEPHLVPATLDARFLPDLPWCLIGDRCYDSDGLDDLLMTQYGIEMIAANRRGRAKTQDGRPLRRAKRRWKIERLLGLPKEMSPARGRARKVARSNSKELPPNPTEAASLDNSAEAQPYSDGAHRHDHDQENEHMQDRLAQEFSTHLVPPSPLRHRRFFSARANERSECATRTERADEAARERACRGVRAGRSPPVK